MRGRPPRRWRLNTPLARSLACSLARSLPALLMPVLASCAQPPERAGTAPGTTISDPFVFSETHPTGTAYMGVRLAGAVRLRPVRMNGLDVVELSGLAWDADDRMLYAVSDNGAIFHLRPVLADNRLVRVELLAAYPLLGPKGAALPARLADAEGLALTHGDDGIPGNARLVVSFERRPRVLVYSPQGRWLAELELPAELREVGRYRSPNKGLESVTWHPALGWLTAPEWPLVGEEFIRIARLEGGMLRYPRLAATDSALVALEAMPDGSLLSLDRSFDRRALAIKIALRRTGPLDRRDLGRWLTPRPLAQFDSFGDWGVDNFEGLCRHQGPYVFIVSDDNQSFLQRTILLYLELLEK